MQENNKDYSNINMPKDDNVSPTPTSAREGHHESTHESPGANAHADGSQASHKAPHESAHAGSESHAAHKDTTAKKPPFDKSRIITGVALIILLALIVEFNSYYLIYIVVGILYALALFEARSLYSLPSLAKLLTLGAIVYAGCFSVQGLPYSGLLCDITLIMILLGLYAYRPSLDARYIYALIYPTLPFIALLTLYSLYGINAIIYLFVIVILTDTFAYFGGRMYGKMPFSPTSPKKTLEGVVIGVAVASIAGMLLGFYLLHINIMIAFVMGLVLSLVSVLGDLFESLLKRRAGLKDSSSILPGHGGILDRLDGVLFAVVALLYILGFFNL